MHLPPFKRALRSATLIKLPRATIAQRTENIPAVARGLLRLEHLLPETVIGMAVLQVQCVRAGGLRREPVGRARRAGEQPARRGGDELADRVEEEKK